MRCCSALVVLASLAHEMSTITRNGWWEAGLCRRRTQALGFCGLHCVGSTVEVPTCVCGVCVVRRMYTVVR